MTFSCLAKRKVTKEKAAPVSRAVRVPCAACLTSAAVELAQSEPQAPRTELKQSSPTSPRSSELLGATQGPQLRNAAAHRLDWLALPCLPRHVSNIRKENTTSESRPDDGLAQNLYSFCVC